MSIKVKYTNDSFLNSVVSSKSNKIYLSNEYYLLLNHPNFIIFENCSIIFKNEIYKLIEESENRSNFLVWREEFKNSNINTSEYNHNGYVFELENIFDALDNSNIVYINEDIIYQQSPKIKMINNPNNKKLIEHILYYK